MTAYSCSPIAELYARRDAVLWRVENLHRVHPEDVPLLVAWLKGAFKSYEAKANMARNRAIARSERVSGVRQCPH